MITASLVGYMSGGVAGGDVDHDDDDEKGQWNRSIASLRSELTFLCMKLLEHFDCQETVFINCKLTHC